MKETFASDAPVSCPASSDSSFAAGPAGLVGERLDHALATLLPHLGLRGRRRSLKNGMVLVNGRPGVAAQRLREKDVITVAPETCGVACAGDSSEQQGSAQQWGHAANETSAGDAPRVLERQAGYWFFYKPAGLHSVALAGGGGASLERLLPQLLAAWNGASPNGCSENATALPQLLQRLDYGTSGLVCAADSPEAVAAFRKAEMFGKCEKRYVAVLQGCLEGPQTVKNSLRTDARQKSVALESMSDRSRWTEFMPLRVWDAGLLPSQFFGRAASETRLTLAACRIRRGARHQIRAHASLLGHELWGDALYGQTPPEQDFPEAECSAPDGFFLHHGGLHLPDAFCAVPPPWPFLNSEDLALIMGWLENGVC